jgi:hypothetical protein
VGLPGRLAGLGVEFVEIACGNVLVSNDSELRIKSRF